MPGRYVTIIKWTVVTFCLHLLEKRSTVGGKETRICQNCKLSGPIVVGLLVCACLPGNSSTVWKFTIRRWDPVGWERGSILRRCITKCTNQFNQCRDDCVRNGNCVALIKLCKKLCDQVEMNCRNQCIKVYIKNKMAGDD
ncbi:hypothetical protein NP493_1359g00013 [Ridgeia piscesae]|uniref:Uncharacterized protein n=1 Tax=Ridgeia piscesae TaxID=27915 RepID=A0AAD9NEP6_RIDPI|nr:hypothetical protein NP493_1359g00013 [Ridgeia piscesae]